MTERRPLSDEILRYLDGQLTREEERSLAERLHSDPAGRRLFVRIARISGNMGGVLSEISTRPTVRRVRPGAPPRTSPVSWLLASAAAILVVVAILASLSPTTPERRDPERTAKKAAPIERPEPQPPPPPAPPAPHGPEPAPVPKEVLQPAPPSPQLPPVPPPSPPAPIPAPAPQPVDPVQPRPATVAQRAVAILERIDGRVFVRTGADRVAATPGQNLMAGQGVETAGARSAAALRFPDRTLVELAGDTVVADLESGTDGKRLGVRQGTVLANVSPQPAAAPMIFRSVLADATVLGTTLRFAVEPGSTRLDVIEGKVRLSRRSDGAGVEVITGYFAVAASGADFTARMIPIDDIVLLPGRATVPASEWRRVKDSGASTGEALESTEEKDSRWTPTTADPHVTFTFAAEAGRDYHVWVRGRCMAAKDRVKRDAVIFEFPDAQILEPDGANKARAGAGKAIYNDWMHKLDYWWIGNHTQPSLATAMLAPMSVRFDRPGTQTIRLYAFESPMRIDAIWLSATQSTRPDDGQGGPRGRRK